MSDDRIPRRAWTVLTLAGIASMLPAINLSVMYVVYPEIEVAFPSVSPARLSWILNAYTVVSAATLILGGVASDRYGRKRAMMFGCATFGAGSVLCALAPNVDTIIAGRVLIGLAAALVVTSAAALSLQEFPAARRATAFGAFMSFGGMAAAAGPSLGSMIMAQGGWRWAFWVNVPIAAVVLVLGVPIFAESRDPTARRLPDPLGAVLLMAGVSLVILALVQSPSWGWGNPATLALLAGGFTLVAMLVRRSARHVAPVLELGLFRYRNFSLLNLAAFLVGVGWFGMFFVLVQFLRNTWDYSLLQAGLLVTPIPFGAGVLGPLGGRVADRVGYRSIIIGGSFAFIAGALWFLTMVGETPDVGSWMVGITFIAIGTGLVFPSVQGGAVVGTPPARYAMATGLNQTIQRVGSAIGNALAVMFLASVGPTAAFNRMFLVVLAMSLAIMPTAMSLRAGRVEDIS